VQQRSDQVAEWVKIVSDKLSESPKIGRPGAAAAASSELGINEREVQRSVKIAAISSEAKGAAREAGLDDNQSKLLAVAKEPTPDRQRAKLVQPLHIASVQSQFQI
jgi:hypothetical protein